MKMNKQHLWRFIGISAGFHLTAIGILFSSAIPSFLSTPPFVSVLQVDLVELMQDQADSSKVSPPSQPPASSKPVGLNPSSDDSEPPAAGQGETTPDPINEGQDIKSAGFSEENKPSPSGLNRLEAAQVPIAPSDGIEPRREDWTGFLAEVRNRLERVKQYPWSARIQGQEGTARVRFVINATGEVQDIRLLESSRSKILDDEAVATVKRAGRFSHLPLAWSQNVQIQVPLVFQLNLP